jgi:predicted ester cyclase
MSNDDSRTIVLDFFEQAINGHDIEALDRFCAEGYIWHGAEDESEQLPEVRGLPNFKRLVAAFLRAFPDFHTDIRDVITEGDRVTVRYVEGGTLAEEFIGLGPTHTQVLWPGIGIFRVEDGKIAEEWFQSAIVAKIEEAAAEAAGSV